MVFGYGSCEYLMFRVSCGCCVLPNSVMTWRMAALDKQVTDACDELVVLCTWGVQLFQEDSECISGKMFTKCHFAPFVAHLDGRIMASPAVATSAMLSSLSHSIVFFVTFLPDFVRTDETSRSFSITAEQCLVKKTQNCRPKFLVCSLSLWNWWTWAFQVDNDRRTDDRLSEGRGHWHVIPFQILDNFCIFVNRWSYRIVSYRYCERRQLPLCPHLCT